MEENKATIEELLIKAKNYEKVLERNKEYHKNNPDKIKDIKIRYYYRKKEENPLKYLEKLEKSKKYYHDVIKPQKLLKAEEFKSIKEEKKANKYLEKLERNKKYYHEVIKPKREALNNQ